MLRNLILLSIGIFRFVKLLSSLIFIVILLILLVLLLILIVISISLLLLEKLVLPLRLLPPPYSQRLPARGLHRPNLIRSQIPQHPNNLHINIYTTPINLLPNQAQCITTFGLYFIAGAVGSGQGYVGEYFVEYGLHEGEEVGDAEEGEDGLEAG